MRVALPEQVWLNLELASYGSRGLAYMVDFTFRWIVVGLVIVTLLYVLSLAGLIEDVFGSLAQGMVFGEQSDGAGAIVLALVGAFVFAVEWSYPVYFEVAHQGVTPGKGLMGLRVVDEQGLPIGFQASALRTLLLLVDMMPLMGFAGLLSMLFTKRCQRLGDLVARTMVVYDPQHNSRQVKVEEHYEKTQVPITLSLEHYNLLEEYLSRRAQLRDDVRSDLRLTLIKLLMEEVNPDALGRSGASYVGDQWLEWIYENAHPEPYRYEEGLTHAET